MNFSQFITAIEQAYNELTKRAVQQVNTAMTVRNWLIGFYLVEFEQNGDDRAVYGQKLIDKTAPRLKHIRGLVASNLKNFRQFYLTYNWFGEYVLGQLGTLPILQTPSAKLVAAPQTPDYEANQRLRLLASMLLNTLTFSHFIELGRVDTELKRRFYEIEAVKNSWSVKELARATTTLLYERTGLSTDKAGMIARIAEKQTILPAGVIKNPLLCWSSPRAGQRGVCLEILSATARQRHPAGAD